jgi:hypothetical protein
MFFRNLLCTVTLATLATAAVAKQIPNPYTSDQGDSTEEVFEREAEPEPARTAAWEQAHGGPAPSFKYGEEHDASAWHIARDANAEPEPEAGWANVGGNRQPKPGNHFAFARDAEPEAEPGWANVGGNIQQKPASWASRLSSSVQAALPTIKPFMKGGPPKFEGKFNQAREADDPDSEDVDEQHEEPEDLVARNANLEIPDFGDEEVDTSLAGLLLPREAVDGGDSDDDDDESGEQYAGAKEDLSGYDAGVLQARSDGTADEIDYSLAGYEAETFESAEEEKHVRLIQARDLAEDEIANDDEYLYSDEHKQFLASHGVTKRSFEDDLQDAEHNRIDARDLPVPDFDGEDVDTSLDGMYLETRDADADADAVVPNFDGQNVDVSLEGYYQPAVQARGAAGDEDEDEKEGGSDDADAAYADAEVVKEFAAPEPELE